MGKRKEEMNGEMRNIARELFLPGQQLHRLTRIVDPVPLGWILLLLALLFISVLIERGTI